MHHEDHFEQPFTMGRLLLITALLLIAHTNAFVSPIFQSHGRITSSNTGRRSMSSSQNGDDDAEELRRKAQELREQIRKMEEQLSEKRSISSMQEKTVPEPEPEGMTLRNKRVLVAGANGRLGSMVCRYLLRTHPNTEVVAAVHVVGENSPTARGYGRLSYEVGAEDGVGSIGPAWSAEDRTATFEFDEAMRDYNLQNLRVVECELLDPVQCMTVVEGCDTVIWCATDFNGNTPRAISGLNVAFLFRAVSRPDKGRVEVEGLENMLGALKNAKQKKNFGTSRSSSNDPINFVLVSTAPDAFEDFETPFGSFIGIKRQGESLLSQFPSLTSTVLQMARYEDNFVEEGLEIQRGGPGGADDHKRRINRRDAAKAVVDALLDEELEGQTVQVWTATR